MMSSIFNLLSNNLASGLDKLSSIFSCLFLNANAVQQDTSLGTHVQNGIRFLLVLLYRVIYVIAKFILLLIDVIYSYMLKLCGLEADYSTIESLFSADSDIVFNMLISAKDLVKPITKNLIGLAIALIIIFTIIALVKSQFDAIEKREDNRVMVVLKKTIKAFFLLMLTPMPAVGGIACSNLLLQSLYRATNLSGTMSIGAKVFTTATTNASTFRNYALNNVKIPVTFDPKNSDDILEYYEGVPANSVFAEYIKSSKNVVYATYMTFHNETFFEFNMLNEVVGSQHDASYLSYNSIYDFDPLADTLQPFRKISSYREEYFVMADAIDYSINTGERFYYMTIENVIDSILDNVSNQELKENIFQSLMINYDIKLHKVKDNYTDDEIKHTNQTGEVNLGTTIYKYDYVNAANNPSASNLIKTYEGTSWNLLSYNTSYMGAIGGTEPNTRMEIQKNHLKGETDELKGAKYVLAVQKSVKDPTTGEKYNYYEPLTVGYCGDSGIDFESEFIMKGQIVTAKGTFKELKYPTVIRKNDDGHIEFYRYDIESQATDNINSLVNLNFQPNFFEKIGNLFKPEDVEVDLTTNLDAVQLTYSRNESIYCIVEGGTIQISYWFKKFTNAQKTVTLDSMFLPMEINFILLLIAPMLMLKMFVGAFFGIIQRGYELFLMIITYPTVVVSIPLDDQAYTNYWLKYLGKLFATYGLILGVNFVLMLFPIIENIEFFTQEEVATNKPLNRICRIVLFGNLPIMQVTNLLNIVTSILFQLAAFTLFESVPMTIANIVSKDADGNLKSDAFGNLMKIVTAIKKAAKVAAKVTLFVIKTIPNPISKLISQAHDAMKGITKAERKAKNARKFKEFSKKLLPGSKIIDAAQDKAFLHKKAKDKKNAEKALKDQLGKAAVDKAEMPEKPGEGASEDEIKAYEEQKKQAEQQNKEHEQQHKDVEAALKATLQATKDELAAVSNPTKQRGDEAEQKHKEKLQGLEKGDSDEDKENENVSSKFGDGEDDDEDAYEDELDYKTDSELDDEEADLEDKIRRLKDEQLTFKGRMIDDAGKAVKFLTFGKLNLDKAKDKKGYDESKLSEKQQAKLEKYEQMLESVKAKKEEREAYKGKEGRANAQNRLNELQGMQAPTEPTPPADPNDPAQMEEYNKQKEQYEKDKKAFDDNQKEIEKIKFNLNRGEHIKQHKKEKKEKAKEKARSDKMKKKLAEIQKEDNSLFQNENASSRKMQNRIKGIQKRSEQLEKDFAKEMTKLNEKNPGVGNYSIQDLMKMDPKELQLLGLNNKVKDMVQEYAMYNKNGSAYTENLIHEQEKQQAYSAQHKANVERAKNREYYARRSFSKVFHPVQGVGGLIAKDQYKHRIENAQKLEDMKKDLDAMKAKGISDPATYKEYVKLNKQYQELKGKVNIARDYENFGSGQASAALREQQKEKQRRRELEAEAIANLGSNASTESVNNYVRRIMAQEAEADAEVMAEGGGGFLGAKNRRRNKIMSELGKSQKVYEQATRSFIKDQDFDISSLTSMTDKELEYYLDNGRVSGQKADPTKKRESFTNQQKEMIRKYVELTNRQRRYNLANEQRKEDIETKKNT